MKWMLKDQIEWLISLKWKDPAKSVSQIFKVKIERAYKILA